MRSSRCLLSFTEHSLQKVQEVNEEYIITSWIYCDESQQAWHNTLFLVIPQENRLILQWNRMPTLILLRTIKCEVWGSIILCCLSAKLHPLGLGVHNEHDFLTFPGLQLQSQRASSVPMSGTYLNKPTSTSINTTEHTLNPTTSSTAPCMGTLNPFCWL